MRWRAFFCFSERKVKMQLVILGRKKGGSIYENALMQKSYRSHLFFNVKLNFLFSFFWFCKLNIYIYIYWPVQWESPQENLRNDDIMTFFSDHWYKRFFCSFFPSISVCLLNSLTHTQSYSPPLVWRMASGYQLEGRHRETGVCGIAWQARGR